ncbi:MAG: hypothetical protein MI717_14750 [Spirochaetales bacterium]|nr:hypothetical protein [Spirochaetales bacterium]
MHVGILGAGYDGLVLSIGMTMLGHHVTVIDDDKNRIQALQSGTQPLHSKAIVQKIRQYQKKGRLCFSDTFVSEWSEMDALFLTKWTMEETLRQQILRCQDSFLSLHLFVTAMIEPGSCRLLQEWFDDELGVGMVKVATYPMHLLKRQGIQDILKQNSIVLGYEDDQVQLLASSLFAPLSPQPFRIQHVTWEAAEMMRNAEKILAASIPKVQMQEQSILPCISWA